MKKKIHNPLVKRIPKELLGDWRKYLVVSLFLILVIGFVSGMYVANESMMAAANNGISEYKLEDGHFELNEKADAELLSAISTGEKADVKAYYTDEAKAELDEKFEDEFKAEFTKEFDKNFATEFNEAFAAQIKSGLAAQGMNETEIAAMLPAAIEQAKQNGDYQTAYDKAYEEKYNKAYDEAYQSAYDEAWDDILTEIDEKYADAEEKYELNDPDFQPVPVKLYENFFRNEDEDNNNDGEIDGTVRVFAKTENINLACLMDGRVPEADDEIAIDRMHADNVGVKVGDNITIGSKSFRIVGLIAYVNYSTLHEKNTDLMFDALKFNVAMVTDEGFDRFKSDVHYNYAWQYINKPTDENAEKKLSDNLLPALMTQTVVFENGLENYLPKYANQAINFATDDMGSDVAMGGVLLDIFIIIIAFIFAVTISNTITKESKTIGTLRASGYTKGELVRHYLAMPVIVTLISAAVGNVLGYTVFKNVVVSMYYNSYSLPAYETIWNTDAFIKTTLIPLVLMFVVNLLIILKKMQHTPLQFLRGDLKKNRRKKAMRLPKWKFFRRFRLRIIFQNIPNYLILFFGVFFIMIMMAMAVGMPETLDYYKENAGDMMFSNYQYVLNSYEDKDGNVVTTENNDAEPFCMNSLQRKSDALNEEISVYGIADNSKYVNIKDLQSLQDGEVYISNSFSEKYGVSLGDTVTLDEKYENKQYSFKVAGFYDKSLNISVFMPIDEFRTAFDLEKDEFSGYLSNTEITDISEDNIATVITEQDITKMCDQLDHSMGSYMQYFQVLCVLLSAVMIYLLSKIIIEKNENAISMTKILGYENREIASLYLKSTTIILLIADAISVLLGSLVMSKAWEAIMLEYSGWFTFQISPVGYAKMFLFVLIGYLIVALLDFRRIKKIPMDQALKNTE
ncbi:MULTISPECIES: FtsX-like permease family protein [unclassified Ruminococcus]|uniref:FtsX-like permease family protein n=1 Tax=unclassified Ruminococcus TaxID=2608920 RepID=UPI00210D4B11|nr:MULTISPECIES: FtsX-like permease family protein [unclassified Ruminococcus]MCQ4022443.1 FtsX-like permease family protein [Ruminococcus sp. zg-924]MCQ4114771.1 FtsX-like permease family protein [Ruminococcus sp. zg-921]